METDNHFKNMDRPLIVAVDLDGTLIEKDIDRWKGPGHFLETKKRVKSVVQKIYDMNDTWVVIWTCRPESEAMREMLDERGIPYDSINSHPFEPEGISRKMPYDILLDDSVFRYHELVDLHDFLRLVDRLIKEHRLRKLKEDVELEDDEEDVPVFLIGMDEDNIECFMENWYDKKECEDCHNFEECFNRVAKREQRI